VKLVEGWTYMRVLWYVNNKSCSGILNTLQFGNLKIWQSMHQAITIIQSRGNISMNNCDKVFTVIKNLYVYLTRALEDTSGTILEKASPMKSVSQSSSRHRALKAFHRYRDGNKSYVLIRYAQSNVNYFPLKNIDK